MTPLDPARSVVVGFAWGPGGVAIYSIGESSDDVGPFSCQCIAKQCLRGAVMSHRVLSIVSRTQSHAWCIQRAAR